LIAGTARKKRKPAKRSRLNKPDGVSLEDWQIELRRQFGREQDYRLKNLGDQAVFLVMLHDEVGVQCHGSVSRQSTAAPDAGTGIQGDTCEREDVPFKGGARAESGGTADLPENVVIRAAGEDDRGTARGRQRAADLENENRIGIGRVVEAERSRQLGRRVKMIDPWRKRESTQILTCQVAG
jgi:hypothetical protein